MQKQEPQSWAEFAHWFVHQSSDDLLSTQIGRALVSLFLVAMCFTGFWTLWALAYAWTGLPG